MATSNAKANAVRESILDAASGLFIEHGIGGTSMQDIADALGVTRTAVYYYFKNKESILAALTEGITRVPGPLVGRLTEKGAADPVTALRNFTRHHAMRLLSHPLQFRVVERNENNLPARQRERGRAARRAFLEQFTEVIRRGVQSGHFRVIDPRVAAFALIGMCNWTAWWFRPSGRLAPEEIADMLADFAVHALQREEARRPKKDGVGESIRLLREDLTYLEQQLHGR